MSDPTNLQSLIATSRTFLDIKNSIMKTDNLMFQSQRTEMMNNSQALRDNWESNIPSMDKNLEILSANKHVIQKIVLEGEVMKGLPISHDRQKEVLDLTTNVTCSMQRFREMSESTTPGITNQLSEQTKILTEQTKDRLKTTKNTIDQLEIFQHDVKTIQDHKLFKDESDENFESSTILET